MSDNIKKNLAPEVILNALFENYESIYAVDIETSNYHCYHESDQYRTLCLEGCGVDFFSITENNIFKAVCPEDIEYVQQKLSKSEILQGLENDVHYSFVYRLMINGEPIYHKTRVIKAMFDQRDYLLISVRNIDQAYRQDKEHYEEISVLQKKEKNHLEAILASAAGYHEVNLTTDSLLDVSVDDLSRRYTDPSIIEFLRKEQSYTEFEKFIAEKLVVENSEKYMTVSNPDHLIDCFRKGDKRSSVSFSLGLPNGEKIPCKKVFYLYQDENTGDILSFCVIYDLTEEQRKEKELRELESELQLSRIRNFTSQMQPHFLYNVLGSIQEIVLNDPEYASQLIGDFTVHLRSCIRAFSSDAPIPFIQELANVRAYVNIEKMRLGEKLRVVYDINTTDFLILPLSIQPIVENAIRHGIFERGKKGGSVLIRSEETPHSWKITVSDTGVGFDAESFKKNELKDEKKSVGLKNLTFRLGKVMSASVDIQSTIGVGTTVVITIPKEVKK